MPEHLRNKESMGLISDSVNHATGTVQTQFHEAFNWALFAPKLLGSHYAYLFKDSAKAISTIAHWQTASLEQRAWAMSDLQQKAMVFVGYASMLALNQQFLNMSGSKQKINFDDPKKSDFLQFKVAGFRVGVMNALVGTVQLLARGLHTAFGERTKYERVTPRSSALLDVGVEYARGKASPLASTALNLASAQDYAHRPLGFLPWSEPLSRAKRLQGVQPYGPGEYFWEEFTPIPIEEAVKRQFMSGGMSESEARKWVRTLVIAGGMSATGARVTEDNQ
jgi:hypothetical protein